MKPKHVLALTTPIALALPLAIAGPAHAASPFPYHDTGRFQDETYDDEWLEDACDLPYDVVTTLESQGNHFARPVRDGAGQAWYGHDNTNQTFTLTRVGTDDSFSVSFKNVWHEVSAQRLDGYEPPADYEVPVGQDGPYYEFTAHETMHAVVRDDSGRVLSRERGVVRWHVIFNTLGDGQPGGEVVVEFEPEVVSGGFVLEDLCGFVRSQLG